VLREIGFQTIRVQKILLWDPGIVCIMKEIFHVDMKKNGIIVEWKEDRAQKSRFFEFQELIRMKVNASDLVMNPGNYRLDEEKMIISPVCAL